MSGSLALCPRDNPSVPRLEQSSLVRVSAQGLASLAIETEQLARGTKMQDYCVYIVGPDGHIQNRIDLICANEAEAKECAVRLVDGQKVELWQR